MRNTWRSRTRRLLANLRPLIFAVPLCLSPAVHASTIIHVQVGFGQNGSYSIDGGTARTSTNFNFGPTPEGTREDTIGEGADAVTVTLRAFEILEPGLFDNCTESDDTECLVAPSTSDLAPGLGGIFGAASGVGLTTTPPSGNVQLDSGEMLMLMFNRPVTIIQTVLVDIQPGEGAIIGAVEGAELLNDSDLTNGVTGLPGTSWTSDNSGVFHTGLVSGNTGNIAWQGTSFYFLSTSSDGYYLQSIAFTVESGGDVPEPATYALAGMSLLAFVCARRWRAWVR